LGVGLLVLALAGITFWALKPETPRLAVFWIFGLAFGFVLQRSQFCFVSAIGNFMVFREGRLLKGLLIGLFVATLGFAVIMFRLVPDPSTGGIPVNAHVAPLGWYLALAGAIFGFGMVLAGGCIVGNLFRLGEGSFSAVTAITGVLIGIGVLQFNSPWWQQQVISKSPQVWLPAYLGWPGAIILTLLVLAILFWLVNRFESRQIPPQKEKISISWHRTTLWLKKLPAMFFRYRWELIVGGLLLGLLNVLEYQVVERPWGITGEVLRWSETIMNAINLSPPPVASVPGT